MSNKRLPTHAIEITLKHVDPFYGCVDIGGTKIAVGFLNTAGQLVACSELPTEASLGPYHSLERIANLLAGGGGTLAAIGVGCTGPVDPLTGVIGDVALLPGWDGFPIARLLESRFQVPVCLENDCDAAALGELNDSPESTRFLYVSISTGIGAGLILDGKIYRGINGAHPELGHHALDSSGPLCYCGARGCWESLASGTAISASYGNGANTAGIFSRAAAGEAHAVEVIEKFTQYFAAGLANLITLFAPDTISVGGGVMASAAQFFDRGIGIARSRAGLVPAHSVQIRPAILGRQAGLIGAAYAARNYIEALEGKSCTHV